MQETKYGTVPTDEILTDCILHGFERMCIVHESVFSMVHHFFSIYWCILFNIAIFIILTNVYTFISVYFYVCRWKVKKNKIINTVNKTFLKITCHGSSSSSDISSSEEWWSLCLDIKARRCIFGNICLWNHTFCLM